MLRVKNGIVFFVVWRVNNLIVWANSGFHLLFICRVGDTSHKRFHIGHFDGCF